MAAAARRPRRLRRTQPKTFRNRSQERRNKRMRRHSARRRWTSGSAGTEAGSQVSGNAGRIRNRTTPRFGTTGPVEAGGKPYSSPVLSHQGARSLRPVVWAVRVACIAPPHGPRKRRRNATRRPLGVRKSTRDEGAPPPISADRVKRRKGKYSSRLPEVGAPCVLTDRPTVRSTAVPHRRFSRHVEDTPRRCNQVGRMRRSSAGNRA